MRNRTQLTTANVKTLSPENGSEQIFWDADTDGLGLRVRNGDRRYLVRYSFAGRKEKLFLGSVSDRPLNSARTEASEVRRDANSGIDPREKRRQSTAYIFTDAVTDYLAHKLTRTRPTTYRQTALYLQRGNYFAKLHKLDVRRITLADVASCIDAIERAHSRLVAHAARSSLRGLFTYLLSRGQVTTNPVVGTAPIVDRDFKNQQMRKRILTDEELTRVWHATTDLGRNNTYGRIIRLLILTGCRRQEVGSMCRSELDLANRIWTIPASRYKTKVDHTVYLSAPALEIIKAAIADADRDGITSDAIFETSNRQRKHAGFQGWTDHKNKLDERANVSDWNQHDLRRTVRSGLASLRILPHIAEMVLGHEQAPIVRTYDHNDYSTDVRDAFERWAHHVTQLTRPKLVVTTPQS